MIYLWLIGLFLFVNYSLVILFTLGRQMPDKKTVKLCLIPGFCLYYCFVVLLLLYRKPITNYLDSIFGH